MNEINQQAIEAILQGVNSMIEEMNRHTTKIYNGYVLSQDGDKWKVQYNGQTHSVKHYGNIQPKTGHIVKVFIPQGNTNLSFFM